MELYSTKFGQIQPHVMEDIKVTHNYSTSTKDREKFRGNEGQVIRNVQIYRFNPHLIFFG